MFGKHSEAQSGGGRHHNQSILQEGVILRGEIEAKGDVRLDGQLEGRVTVSERLTIGATGVVKGDVDAGEVIVMGTFEGRIRAHRRIELRKGAKVTADVHTSSLIIEEGVVFHGHSNMNPVPSGAEIASAPAALASAESEALAELNAAYR